MPYDANTAKSFAKEREERIARAREKAQKVDAETGKPAPTDDQDSSEPETETPKRSTRRSTTKKTAPAKKRGGGKVSKNRGQEAGPPEGGWDASPFGSHTNDRMINSIVIFGESGSGKSTIAGAAPGDKVGLSFDNKLDVIAEKYRRLFPNERFTVYNGARYYPPNLEEDEITLGGHRTLEYLEYLLETKIRGQGYKWAIVDSTDIYIKAMEHAMRWEEGFGPFSPMGENNWVVWGIRNRFIKKFLNDLADAVECGIIITAYYGSDTSVSTEFKEPAWPNQLRELVKVELHAWKDVERGKHTIDISHVAENMQSKDEDFLRTGDVYDMHEPDLRNAIARALGMEEVDEWFAWENPE